jgi:hypothetical protein
MPERPLLKLPDPEPFDPKPGPRGGGSLAKPSRATQGARLAPRFDRLMRVAGNPQELMGLRDDPASIAPERAIVFEVAGQLKDFYAQAQAIGLEYLGDYEEEFAPNDEFYDTKKPGKAISGCAGLAGTAWPLAPLSARREHATRQIGMARTLLAADRRSSLGATGSGAAGDD